MDVNSKVENGKIVSEAYHMIFTCWKRADGGANLYVLIVVVALLRPCPTWAQDDIHTCDDDKNVELCVGSTTSCAWCWDAPQPRCMDFDPCANRTVRNPCLAFRPSQMSCDDFRNQRDGYWIFAAVALIVGSVGGCLIVRFKAPSQWVVGVGLALTVGLTILLIVIVNPRSHGVLGVVCGWMFVVVVFAALGVCVLTGMMALFKRLYVCCCASRSSSDEYHMVA